MFVLPFLVGCVCVHSAVCFKRNRHFSGELVGLVRNMREVHYGTFAFEFLTICACSIVTVPMCHTGVVFAVVLCFDCFVLFCPYVHAVGHCYPILSACFWVLRVLFSLLCFPWQKKKDPNGTWPGLITKPDDPVAIARRLRSLVSKYRDERRMAIKEAKMKEMREREERLNAEIREKRK